MPTYCIMCAKQRQGLPVEDDHVLNALRWFKRNVTKNEQRNKLVVCKEDYPKYKRNRDKYVLRGMIFVSLGVLFMLLALIISLSMIIPAFIVFLLLCALSLMNYTPKVRTDSGGLTSKDTKHHQ